MLKPDLIVRAAHDVTPELLRRHGIRGVLVDLDDTLVASNESHPGPDTEEWLQSLRSAGIPVVVLSNGERARVEEFCRRFEVEGLHLAGKPFWWAFRRALQRLDRPPAECAMIGDQIFTDVLGANLAGMKSILVRPLSPGRLPHTRIARRLERLILGGGGHGRTLDR